MYIKNVKLNFTNISYTRTECTYFGVIYWVRSNGIVEYYVGKKTR